MDATNWLVQFFSFLKPSIQIIQKSPSYFSVPRRIFFVYAIQYECFKRLDSFKGIPLSHSHPQNWHPHTELLFPVPLVFPPHRAIAIQPHQEDIFFAASTKDSTNKVLRSMRSKGATHVQCIIKHFPYIFVTFLSSLAKCMHYWQWLCMRYSLALTG